jgi:rubredoxin
VAKIVTPGRETGPVRTHGWWVGRRLTCAACGAVYELEDGDAVQAYRKTVLGGAAQEVAGHRCPACGAAVTLARKA